MDPPTADGDGPLCLLLSCPKCGGPFEVDDLAVSAVCPHCRSLMRLQAQREEIYLAEGCIHHPEEVLEVVVSYRVQAQRAEIVSRYRDSDGNPPPEAFVEKELRVFEQSLRETARLIETHCVHVPYWHFSGTLVQAVLGREHDGPKKVRVRGYGVEHTLPGYDTACSNFRDRGLRLSRARVRPLGASDVRQWRAFLPHLAPETDFNREIEKWRGRNLESDFDPVVKHSQLILARRVRVLRPYWLARVITDGGQEWVLVDGSFATIAGHPGELEVRGMLERATAEPLGGGAASSRHVHVVASRCPDCGHEQSIGSRDHLVVCPNCHLGLDPGPAGIRIHPYGHVPGGDVDYLPFWRFRFVLRGADGRSLTSLEEHANALFGARFPAPFRGPHLWVPAVQMLGTGIGDRAFKDLAEWIHAAVLDVHSEKISLGGKPRPWPVTLPEDDARELAPLALFGLHGKASAARLNGMIVRKGIAGVAVSVSDPTLIYLPAARVGDHLMPAERGPGIPLLLLHGGPALDVQRVTVHSVIADSRSSPPGVVTRL